MATETRILCDCCGAELVDASVIHAATVMYQADDGRIVTAVFGIECDCGPDLVSKGRDQRDHDHKRMKNAGVERLPEPFRAGAGKVTAPVNETSESDSAPSTG